MRGAHQRVDLLAGGELLGDGGQALHAAGLVDLSKSIYTTPNFTWLSFIVGMLAISLAAICERRWGQPPTNVLILHNASQSPTLRQPIDSARIRCPRRGWNIG